MRGNASIIANGKIGKALSDILKTFAHRPLSHKGQFHCLCLSYWVFNS